MKRILFSFLILTMLTPMLVCGTGFGVKEARAAESCHAEMEMTDKMPEGVMFMLDCMNVDFQAAGDYISVEKPDQEISKVIYVLAGELPAYSSNPVAQNTIRGPPDRQSTRNISSSLILTTQRFRI